MPISCINNDQNYDQNIIRAYTKMSEPFPDQNNTKLTNIEDRADFFAEKINNTGESSGELELTYDHMYTSSAENGVVSSAEENCQSAESEVKFWKDWLILHLDLIQQQSDEILNKERTILILQQENEMLKDRISCMERGAPFQPNKFFANHSNTYHEQQLDMTQDSGPCEEDNKTCIEIIDLNCENGDDCSSLKISNFEENPADSPRADQPCQSPTNYNNCDNIKFERGEIIDNNSSAEFDFTISNSSEFDPMKNLRMSIRRKRLSNSSAVSNNDSAGDENKSCKKIKKRRKRSIKDTQMLTSTEPYITEAGESNVRISNIPETPLEIPNNTNLEVPRWRVKLYASCYTMEGTENLDDEVYNKRHSRLENDERRRKRWDVQRIREQRVIEKLKQRQERTGSGARPDEPADPVHSLWPSFEDIKYLEVSEQLPVSAFGCSIPKVEPSEFTLPWLDNPALLVTKKVPAKRSIVRRRNFKR